MLKLSTLLWISSWKDSLKCKWNLFNDRSEVAMWIFVQSHQKFYRHFIRSQQNWRRKFVSNFDEKSWSVPCWTCVEFSDSDKANRRQTSFWWNHWSAGRTMEVFSVINNFRHWQSLKKKLIPTVIDATVKRFWSGHCNFMFTITFQIRQEFA